MVSRTRFLTFCSRSALFGENSNQIMISQRTTENKKNEMQIENSKHTREWKPQRNNGASEEEY